MIDRAETLRRIVLHAARFTGAAHLARPLLGGVGGILMLHRVNNLPAKPLRLNSHLTVAPAFLDRLIQSLKRQRYLFVTMDEAVERLRAGASPQRFIAVTADDAYRDNLTDALPILEKHGVPIAIYVSPGLVEGKADLWWDVLEDVVTRQQRIYLPTRNGHVTIECAGRSDKIEAFSRIGAYFSREMREEEQNVALREIAGLVGVDPDKARRDSIMNWDEIRRMAAHELVTIGAHTTHHFRLRRLDREKALREMSDAAGIIAVETGKTPRHMAYPYGTVEAVGPREVELAGAAGFQSAVTTRHGVLVPGHAAHLCALPRISVNGRYQRVGHVTTMLSGLITPLANSGRRLVTV